MEQLLEDAIRQGIGMLVKQTRPKHHAHVLAARQKRHGLNLWPYAVYGHPWDPRATESDSRQRRRALAREAAAGPLLRHKKTKELRRAGRM